MNPSMLELSVKDKILRTIQELPADVTFDNVMERLYVLYKVEIGLEQTQSGQGISHEDAKQHLKKWDK